MTKENSLKNNKIFKWAVIVIALFLDFGLRFVPAPNGMSQEAFGVIGILLGSLLLWFTVSIDWPSLLCILALGLLPSYGVSNALSSAFGNDTLLFLMFTFVCTYALSKTTRELPLRLSQTNGRRKVVGHLQFCLCFLHLCLECLCHQQFCLLL